MYTRWKNQIERLSLERRGMLFTAIMAHQSGEEIPELDEVTEMAFGFIRDQLDADAERYKETCRKRREGGKLGGRKKKEENLDVIEEPKGSEENLEVSGKPIGFRREPVTYDNEYENDNENDSDNDIKVAAERIPYAEIVGYLNLKAGTSYRADAKETRKHIRARWSEGFRTEDFKTVIDKKTAEWKTDAKMAMFLRPLTLFSTKFESYLNQPTKKKTGFSNFQQRDTNLDELEAALDRQFAAI